MPGRKLEQLEVLKRSIAALENRPPLATGAGISHILPRHRIKQVAAPLKVRNFELPALGGKAVPVQDNYPLFLSAGPGALEEVFSDDARSYGAALGFALGVAQRLLTKARPALMVVQLARDITESGVPYGPGLSSFGIDPDQLVLARVENVTELLWAIEEAVSCPAVAAVIADVAGYHKELNFTASRRLSLRAAATGTSAFIIRYEREREASAARLRWRVTPEPSSLVPDDSEAPGHPRWHVVLEKGRLRGNREGGEFRLDWTENGFFLVEHGREEQRAAPRQTPLSGAQSAALAYRLPQAG